MLAVSGFQSNLYAEQLIARYHGEPPMQSGTNVETMVFGAFSKNPLLMVGLPTCDGTDSDLAQ